MNDDQPRRDLTVARDFLLLSPVPIFFGGQHARPGADQ